MARAAGRRAPAAPAPERGSGPTAPSDVESRDGQSSAMGHAVQRGRRAWQTWRPCRTPAIEKAIQSAGGTIAIRSRSIATGSSLRVRPSRRATRAMCVSTTIPAAMPCPAPRTTLAVFLPTPGRRTRSSMVRGTWPACLSTSARAHPWIDFALARKKPVDRIAASTFARGARAREAGSGQVRNRSRVTMLTRASVDCAERIVATRSWYGSV